MKKYFFKWIQLAALTAGLFFMVSCSGDEQTESDEENEKTEASYEGGSETEGHDKAGEEQASKPAETAVEAYLKLKNALVATDADAAKTAATVLAGFAEGEIKTAAETLAGSGDVETQRAHFKLISEQLYVSVKENGAAQTLYKQHCPMAFEDTGAFWLSAEKEVNNPYFGDKMLHCGTVKEELAVK